MEIYGYVRVSSTDQNEDRQMLALRKQNIAEKIYTLISYREKILTDRHTKGLYENCEPGICSTSSLLTVWGEIMRKFKINGEC